MTHGYRPCRTCSECDGNHHWVDMSCFEDDDGHVLADPFCGYGCKHCDLRSEQCEGCENPVYPSPDGAEFCPECATETN